jgi:chaperonin GroES
MNVKPTLDRVIVEPEQVQEKTASGIFIPDAAKEKPQKGIVLAVGEGKKAEQTGVHIAMSVQVGDLVLYSKHAGTELNLDDKKYLILRESDIFAVL